ncbi:hypothetical protein X772_26575 [Mesorhizobium sp. LSJC280B00]|nr:hypothetical protein X772_26575 [Mesorhizobium sp. LSJC280B00]
MLTKSAPLEIDPDTRAFTLVGAFMGHFALLELASELLWARYLASMGHVD